MIEIKRISEQIDEELEDAEKYLKCANKYRESNATLSNMYYSLSVAEMGHVDILHDAVVKIINDYKAQGNEVPESMQALYDYLHERHIKWARKIRQKQEEYKS
jgi:phage regulator Rha-like protein